VSNLEKFSWYNRSVITSCRDCKERYPACHDTCEKYQNAKRERDEQLLAIEKAKSETRLFADYKVAKITKERRQGKSAGRRV
jgi:hypothetical protein